MVVQKRLRDLPPAERERMEQSQKKFRSLVSTANPTGRGIVRLTKAGSGIPLSPDPHQLTAACRLYARNKDEDIRTRRASLLLMHEVGTGKTITAILAMAAVSAKAEIDPFSKILIVVPKSVLEIWYDTINTWTTKGNLVLKAAKQEEISHGGLRTAFAVLTTPDVLVEAFKTFCYMDKSPEAAHKPKMKRWKLGIDPKPTNARGKKRLEECGEDYKPPMHPLFEHLRRAGDTPPFLLTIVDEIHDGYRPTTERGFVLNQFTMRSTYKLGLTGTPVSAKPDEFQYIAFALDAHPKELQTRQFYFVGKQQAGKQQPLNVKSINDFHRLLVDRVDASFLDLPERTILHLVYDPFVGSNPVDATTDANAIAYHNKLVEDAQRSTKQLSSILRQTTEHDWQKWGETQQAAFKAITAMGQFEFHPLLGMKTAEKFRESEKEKQNPNLYQQAAAAPSEVMRLIVRLITSRQAACHPRIAVFCESETELEILYLYLASMQGLGQLFFFRSSLTAIGREKMRANFLACPKGVILLTKAGSVGITLCPGCEVMLSVGSLPWNATTIDQAFGRIYRRGQTKKVEIIQLVARNSVTAVKLLLHEDKRERLARALADRDWSKFAEGDTKWRKTERIIGQCHLLNDKGNYVDPDATAKLAAYVAEQKHHRTLKEQADANGVAPPPPPVPPAGLDMEYLRTGPLLPSQMPLPAVTYPGC